LKEIAESGEWICAFPGILFFQQVFQSVNQSINRVLQLLLQLFKRFRSAFSKPEKVMVPESEKKNLVALNASVFLDQELGEVWEKQDVEGRSMFVRKNEDNIEELLSKLYLTASYGARTMVKAELFVPQVLVGMAVRFYAYENGKPSILTGNIVDISAEGIDIEIPSETETKKYRVKPDAILQAESINNINQCVDYLRKCYNPKDGSFDYAGMFLKKR
jgi:hypothetical protein